MDENRTPWPLEEPLNPQIKGMVLGGIAGVSLYALIAMISADREFDAETILVLVLILGVTAALLLLLLLITNRARLVLNDQGALTRSVQGKVSLLDWKQLHTAAIVKVNNNANLHWIVLSIHDPAEVISRKRLTWKNPKRDEELRIPFTLKRRVVVEHYLNMTLPEIKL